MIGKSVIRFSPLVEGTLIKRYKRFLADIELDSGEVVTAHCANTGPMKGVLHIGGRVRLRHVASTKRKLDWSWEQAEVKTDGGSSCWVGVNTSLPNALIRHTIEQGYLNTELGALAEIRQEVVFGRDRRSRIDFCLTPEAGSKDVRKIFLEVKNTTWRKGSSALFPDTVTHRGQKHLRELIEVLPHSRAILVPCLSRSDVDAFSSGDDADPKYGELFRLALVSGVEVIPCCFGFHRDRVTWEGRKAVLTNPCAS